MTTTGNHTLSDQAAAWVIDSIQPGAAVVSAERLKGGVSSVVHGITLLADGNERHVVLRQIDNADWLQSQPDIARQEAESLRKALLAGGGRTPALLAYDETGSQSGMPAVLMSRLEGRVVLEPADMSLWLDGLARELALLHGIEAEDHAWTFGAYADASKLDASRWTSIPEAWKTASAIVTGHRPAFEKRFIHRDYHPCNVLWKDGEVSGVVDWVNGCIGPAGVDVGHCRVNLALLHGVRQADEFLERYRHYAEESFAYDPYWDLVTLIDFAFWQPEVYAGWTDLGVTGLTARLMVERLDAYVSSLLRRYEDMREDGR
ncbi:phosphotransferase family protein [Paenibacillus soyae]|uniref:Aminoglycoside phosphotransferase family protein n=1 Tax=Paenibacillus soyae TaxID=2969249 RepID=A0A9X2MVB6_9BACL|nr:aminoglycoside phosphotransferase family protein [Paenibacillus soyae]